MRIHEYLHSRDGSPVIARAIANQHRIDDLIRRTAEMHREAQRLRERPTDGDGADAGDAQADAGHSET